MSVDGEGEVNGAPAEQVEEVAAPGVQMVRLLLQAAQPVASVHAVHLHEHSVMH